MPKDFEDKDTGWSELIRDLTRLGKDPTQVAVGFFTEEVATYATVNEMGSPSNNIRERPFMRTTFDINEDKYTKMLEDAVRRSVEGGGEIQLLPVGNEVRNDLIDTIINWTKPENKKSTVDAKGFDNPLVDTGQMQRAVQVHLGAGGDE